jgi:hypothetical protein
MLIGNKHVLKNKANLSGVKMSVRPVITRDYGDLWFLGGRENKANHRPLAGNPNF